MGDQRHRLRRARLPHARRECARRPCVSIHVHTSVSVPIFSARRTSTCPREALRGRRAQDTHAYSDEGQLRFGGPFVGGAAPAVPVSGARGAA
jgi:hypothetical protein